MADSRRQRPDPRRGANLENTLALVQKYDRHKEIYRPDVIDSRLIARDGNLFQVYLRLLDKKIITVVLEMENLPDVAASVVSHF